MQQVLAVIGQPGTGKTTLFREFMSQHAWTMVEPVKLLPCHYCAELDLYVLGKYEDGELFAGTDRLSLAVQPAAVEFLKNTKSNVLFEGDRLGTSSFLTFLSEQSGLDFEIFVLRAADATLANRYKQRGSEQSEQFLSGRRTKVNNIANNLEFMSLVQELRNETYEDQQLILGKINNKFKTK